MLTPIVATLVSELVQVTEVVISGVEPSEYVPVAVNCWVLPRAIVGLSGVTTIESSTASVTVSEAVPLTPARVAVMVVVPGIRVVAKPPAAIVATELSELVQVAVVVISAVEASEYVPVAVNCWVLPAATDGAAGVTAIETSSAPVTVKVVLPLMSPKVAVMVVVPGVRVVAKPPAAIVATEVSELDQVTVEDISAVEPLEYVPVAVNCWVWPAGIDGLSGVTTMASSTLEATVRVVVSLISPDVAVMVVVPSVRL